MVGFKILFIAICTLATVLNYMMYEGKISQIEHVVDYFLLVFLICQAFVIARKFPDVPEIRVSVELSMISSVFIFERIVYYNESKDLDSVYYGKVVVFYCYWLYQVDERVFDAGLNYLNQEWQRVTLTFLNRIRNH